MKMVRLLVLGILLACFASQAFSAVAFVQVYQGKDETGTGGVPFTLASVDGTGGNLLTCDVTWRINAAQTLDAITFNSTSIIGNEIGSLLSQSGGAQRSFYFNGTMANASVVVTMSAAVPTIQVICHSYSGANATPIGNVATSNNVGTVTTTSANTGADDSDLIHDFVSIRASPTSITAGTDQTERGTQATAGTLHARTSTQPGNASDDTMSWSWTGSQNWTHKAYVIEASGGAQSNVPRAMHYKRLMGLNVANDDEILLRATR